RQPVSGAVPAVHAAVHERTWTVRQGGVAEVNIALGDITSGGQDVPIALLDHPHGGVSDNQPVVWDGGNREPEKRYLGGGRTRYTFNAERLLYDSISWSYHLSNAVALNQAELQLREQRLPLFPNLNVDSDAVSHVVRLDSDVLRLTLTFQSETGATILDPRPL